MGEEAERARHPHTVGPLSQEQAAAIDQILADPCFAIQPDYTPFFLPLRGGQVDQCSGAISNTVRIRRGDQIRMVSDACGRWPSHALAGAVMYAAIPLTTVIEQTGRARYGETEFHVRLTRQGRQYGPAPVYCGEIDVDGRTRPMLFTRWYGGGLYRNQFLVEGDGQFNYIWRNACAEPPQQQPQPS
jgi:hypothetical protein